MFLDQSEHSGIRVLSVGGELGGSDDEKLVERIGDLLSGPGDRVIIDLSQVTYINSRGINTLVRITAQANVQEQRVVFASPSNLVEGVFRTTQLIRFFDVYPTLDEAVKGLQ